MIDLRWLTRNRVLKVVIVGSLVVIIGIGFSYIISNASVETIQEASKFATDTNIEIIKEGATFNFK